MKPLVKKVGLAVLRLFFGVTLIDQRTGKVIGKVVVVRWKGGLRLIGLDDVAVRPHFLLQQSERYWAQDLGFSTYPSPDFSHVENSHRADLASDASRGDSHVSNVAGPES